MSRLLVFRLSAMGDVALLAPVLKGVLDANKDVEIYLLTRPLFFPFFQGIDRLHLVEARLKAEHKGICGLYRLYRELKKEVKPDFVVDAHKVIRTYVLDLFFKLSGYRVIKFDKGSNEKKQIIKTKRIKVLPTTVERYASIFIKNGYPVKLPSTPVFHSELLPEDFQKVFANSKPILIGIAPFARHRQKIWGKEKVEKLIERINQSYECTIVLFGGGKSEIEVLKQIAGKYQNCIVSANHFNLQDEITLLPRLHVMISMDSANMHIAALAGVPTISVWGATHPALGFSPYRQPPENIIQYSGDQLSCRPCSVYGNKKCIYTDVRCMEYISIDSVFERVSGILSDLPGALN